MASTTAAVIISDALKEIGVIGEGETPTATMYSDGLRMINRMLETLSHSPAFEFSAYPQITKTLAGQSSFKIGPTGDVVAERPIKINSALCTFQGIDYPADVIDADQYDALEDKSTTGSVPWCVYYGGEFPDASVYLWPISTGGTLKLRCTAVLKQFASTSTQIELPPGYEDYLMLGLAIRAAPQYQKTLNPETRLAYRAAKTAVKKTNTVIPLLTVSGV